MSQKTIQNLIIECVTGDIARQPDMDAIVHAPAPFIHARIV